MLSTHLMGMLAALVAAGSVASYARISGAAPTVALGLSEEAALRRLPRERCDQATLRFDLDADLRPLWSWNVNHMYVSVVAGYVSGSHVRNEIVVWDYIVSGREEAVLKLQRQMNKYSLKDHGYGLKGAEVDLSFRYSIMPHMGVLMYGEQAGQTFTLPAEYLGAKTSY
jgi:Signal peptidase subunit